MQFPSLSLLCVLLPGSTMAFRVTSTTNSAVPVDGTTAPAEYSCVLTNRWSSATHPVGYPGGSAHWTAPVLAAHTTSYTMWSEGGMASAGVENVAELGITETLQDELQSTSAVGDFVIGIDQFNNRDGPQTLPTIQMDSTNRLLSVVTMVAPSPDWFSGFYNVEPINPTTSTWYRTFTIDSFPWDAGTEQGSSFSLGNPASSPQEPIMELTADTVPSNGVFLDPTGTQVLRMATWTCTLANADPPASQASLEPFTVVRKVDSNVVAAQPGLVDYVCTFQNRWSATRHPALYPSGSAHWSPPILASHTDVYTMWKEGGMASAGVEQVAELGATGALLSELSGSTEVYDDVTGESTFNNVQQMQTFDSIQLTKTSRYLSTITMIAPSPDWFSGFYNFEAVNRNTNKWYREFVIDTYPWDAGTEDGNTYSFSNPASNPIEPIKRFNPSNVPATKVFLSGSDSQPTVLPVATWTCTLQQQDPQASAGGGFGCFSGRTFVEVQDRGVITMDQLKVGDNVKVDHNNNYERVYGFGHYSNTLPTSYLQIYTNDDTMKEPLEVTKDHMVFVSNHNNVAKAVPASMIKVGDILVMTTNTKNNNGDNGPVTRVIVKKIKTVTRVGSYAPFTMSGTIVVNGVVASSYVSLQEDSNTLVLLRGSGDERKYDTSVSHHTLAHLFTTPYRVWCRLVVGMLDESYNSEGIATWIEGPHNLANNLLRDGGRRSCSNSWSGCGTNTSTIWYLLSMLWLFIVSVIIILPSVLIEAMLNSPGSCMVAVGGGAFVCVVLCSQGLEKKRSVRVT